MEKDEKVLKAFGKVLDVSEGAKRNAKKMDVDDKKLLKKLNEKYKRGYLDLLN